MLLFLYLVSRCAIPEASTDTAKKDVVLIDQAAQLYRMQHRGACPPDLEALAKATKAKLQLDDPWGTDYDLSCPDSTRSLVRSAGPDKKLGTADDIDNGHD